MSAVSPSRQAAFHILMAVERGQSHSDDLLRSKAVSALSPPDRNLATTLVLGVLRWQIRLDHQLRALLTRPNAKLDPEILVALRLGAFQLLHLDRIPARAAIDESVELAKQSGHRFASRMVNAVLRKLAQSSGSKDSPLALKEQGSGPAENAANSTGALLHAEKQGFVSGHDFSRAASDAKSTWPLGPAESFPPDSPADLPFSAASLAPKEMSPEELSLTHAHPAWLVERWAAYYGLEAARDLCRHGQTQPVPSVRIESSAAEAELSQAGVELVPGELLTAARTVLSGDVTATAAFREGRIRLQDEGSQLIAEIAGQGSAAHTILDCCAAPGGKTLILAERNPQVRIVACESSPQRLAGLRKRLAAYAAQVECRLADAAALEESSAFDVVLADVPCSGTGTLGRNPEIRHRLRPADLPRQAERQRAILRAALRAVRPGGRVIYSTCSLEPEENEQVVAVALAEFLNARPIPLHSQIESLLAAGILTASGAQRLRSCLTPEGALRLLPGACRTDGFFIALIERTTGDAGS